MSQILPSKIVLIDGLSNKHRRCKKPWWNDDLTSLWNEVCSAEKIWIKCQNSHLKKALRHKYVQKRKLFDRNVKKAKPICVLHLLCLLLNPSISTIFDGNI
jgi:hypothetical protein